MRDVRQAYTWSSDVAYGIGLMTTDGNLSKDGRHIDFTSKDIELIQHIQKCFDITVRISYKTSGYTHQQIPRIQFSNVALYRFFESIGLSPAKTKTMGEMKIPKTYYVDFLRGHLDGDGYFYAYYDPRWPRSYLCYVNFVSASKAHIHWLQATNQRYFEIVGSISWNKGVYMLRYAKKETLVLLKKMYYTQSVTCLKRKLLKIRTALHILEVTI